MSIAPKFSMQTFEELARAHAQKNSGVLQHDDQEKICKQNLLLRPKATNPISPTFVVFCCYLLPQQKIVPKCCSTLNKHFLLRKFFSKSVSKVSKYKKMTLVTGRRLILR